MSDEDAAYDKYLAEQAAKAQRERETAKNAEEARRKAAEQQNGNKK